MTGQNWLLGNSVQRAQWESSNASVAFPFEDDSLPEGFPTDAVVDACVVVASELATSQAKVELGCLHFGPHLVSAMLFVGGEPALACMASSSYEPYTPLAMEPLKEGCSGTITFGNVMSRGSSFTYRGRIPLAEGAVVRPVVGRLRRFVRVATGQTASGDIGIELPEGVSMDITESEDLSIIRFSITDEARAAIEAPCAGSSRSGLVPITNINGVYPDDQGRIAVIFGESDGEVG